MDNVKLKIELEMNKSQWLCYNCIFSGLCYTESQSKKPIIQCEEHFSKGSNQKPYKSSDIQTEKTNHLGLCSTCDHKDSCSLKTDSEIIITCEHYQ